MEHFVFALRCSVIGAFKSARMPARVGRARFGLIVLTGLLAAAAQIGCGAASDAPDSWDRGLDDGEKLTLMTAMRVEASPQAIRILIEATADPDEEMSVEALRALGRTQSPDGLPTLIERTGSEFKAIRHAAAWGLGALGNSEGVPALVELLTDPEKSIRSQAVGSLSKIGDPSAADGLVEVLLNDPDEELRVLAVQVVGKFGEQRTVPYLEEALMSGGPDMRSYAARALGMLGDPSCIPALLSTMREDDVPMVRGASALALGTLGDPGSVKAIREAGELEAEPIARASMAWSVGMLSGADPDQRGWVLSELTTILLDTKGSEFAARGQAARALGNLNACEAKGALRRALNDRKGIVKDAASEALSELSC